MARSTVPSLLLAVGCVLASAPGLAGPVVEVEATTPAAAGDGSFIPPQIILGTQRQPDFPPAAWDARIEGAVLLEMKVLKDGKVGEVKVVQCTRPKVGFEDAAVAAVKKWRFEPGMENGEPIEVLTRLKLNFTRVGVGVRAQPQVSAGSLSVESHDRDSSGSRSRAASPPSGGVGK